MIRFSLVCAAGHEFDSWFASSDAYDGLVARGLVECPHCGATKVEKGLMTPQVARKDRAAPGIAMTPAPVGEAASGPMVALSAEEVELRAKIKALRDHVVANAENVGPRFAEEARKMHEGEIEHRAIYGAATPDETRSLREEGVEVYPLPMLPEDRN